MSSDPVVTNDAVCVPPRLRRRESRTEILAPSQLTLPPVPTNANVVFDETLFTDGFSIRDSDRVVTYNAADRYLAQRLGKRVSFVVVDAYSQSLCPRADPSDNTRRARTVNINPPVPCFGLNVYTMNALSKTALRTVPYNRVAVLPTTGTTSDRVIFNSALQTESRVDETGIRGQLAVPADEMYRASITDTGTSETSTWQLQQQQPQPRPSSPTSLADGEPQPITLSEFRDNTVYTVNDELSPFEMAIMIKYYAVNDHHAVFVTDHLYHTISRYFVDQRRWFDRGVGSLQKLRDYTIRNSYCELIRDGALLNVPPLAISGPAVTV